MRPRRGDRQPTLSSDRQREPATGRPLAALPRSPNEMLEPARAPDPPRRSARRRREVKEGGRRGGALGFLNASLTILLVLMLMAAGAAFAVKYEFERPGPLDHSTVVVIPQGEGVLGIASRLQREGVITDSRILMAGYYWVRWRAGGGKPPILRAGEYEIRKNSSMRQVLETLVEGKAILYKVTVPEGLTSRQIIALLSAQPDLTGQITEVPAEGSLLPDTYKFSRGTDRNEIIARMQADHQKYMAKQWQTRSSRMPFDTPEEAIILASIVEKETSRADERDRIAGVFVNRLQKGMRLQSDPTLIYELTAGRGNLGRGILKSELEAKSAYNTYQIDGLPPTPICNPGRAAIEAVLNPAETKDIYFVADGTGGHAFAVTIRDHQNNVLRWRKIEKERAKAAASAEQAGGAAQQADVSAGPGVALEMAGVNVEDGEPAAEPVAMPTGKLKAGAVVEISLPKRKPKKN